MIRPARDHDVAAVAAVHLAGFRAGHGPHVAASRLAELGLERQQAVWESLVRHPSPAVAVLVAERTGDVTAVAAAGPSRDEDAAEREGEVYAFYVDPARWGSGDAIALHAAALAHLRRQGFTSAVLWTLVANARARRFYAREGWDEDGSRQERFGTPTLRMRRIV